MNEKITVIIPVYNAQQTLVRCLSSVEKQTYEDWSAIIVDDGSTDESSQICDAFASMDRRFQVFHKENGGVSSARNLGLSKAQGAYVTFLDADDYLAEDSFKIAMANIGDHDMLIGQYQQFDSARIGGGKLFIIRVLLQ